MRIAIIGKKFPFCGIVTYCRELVGALRAAGHTVAFFYLHNGEVAEEYEDPLPYVLRTHMYVVPSGDAKTRLATALRQFKPDVVHASYALSFLDFALPDICTELGVPLVATFHVAFDHRLSLPNQVSAWTYRLYARTLSRCDRVVVFSEPQAEKLQAVGVRPERAVILPNGVDIERYRPGPSRYKAESGARQLVSYMGRIDPEKNVGALLAAFTRLQAPEGLRLALMGDGVLAGKLRQKYEGHPAIDWLGFVEDEAERIDILRGSDVFVLPSSVEGLSLALLEAMACGAAPVATDVGADGEVIRGCGRVLDPKRLRRELGPHLAELLGAPGLLKVMGAAARARVVERYAYHKNLERLVEVYEGARYTRRRAAG